MGSRAPKITTTGGTLDVLATDNDEIAIVVEATHELLGVVRARLVLDVQQGDLLRLELTDRLREILERRVNRSGAV